MTLLKLSLLAFSFVFWAAGLTMLIIGLWAKVSLGSYLALSASGYPSAPAILLATGVAVIIWGFLGCFGAATEHRGLLRAYSAFLAAVLAAGLAAGLSALLYRQTLAQGFQAGLRQALLAYGEDDGVADALDALQRALSCCGVQSYRDWLASPWGRQQNGSVPLSCCRARRGCRRSPPDARRLHRAGCFGAVSAFVGSNMFYVATAALGLALLQLVGIIHHFHSSDLVQDPFLWSLCEVCYEHLKSLRREELKRPKTLSYKKMAKAVQSDVMKDGKRRERFIALQKFALDFYC
ncbi:Tetraspanin-7 [Lonchura striata]|uniref:Tetraspanin-7 n=1 Tax=Lonchura striata TaxID=40157 RepID=A0A218UYL5_9PASE|nr:Tetraspanin-7 [Lonchura striata domestica]